MKYFIAFFTTTILVMSGPQPMIIYAQGADHPEKLDLWYQVKVKDNVTVSRRTSIINASEYRETKASTHISQSIGSMLEVLSGNSEVWQTLNQMKDLKDFNVATDKKSWDSYIVVDMPWPLKDQDLVIQCDLVLEDQGKKARIEVTCAPELLPEQRGLARLEKFQSVWLLEEVDMHTTRVDYISVSVGQPKFPRWITDPIVYKSLITLLGNLREMSEAPLAFQSQK